jgi:predicted DNA-binding protein YlxM (UPF0122 family)
MSKDVERFSLLLDFYAPLLTDRQRELISAYYLDDLSLGEIAAAAGVSRQAVHDLIKRAEQQLLACEERLGLVAEHLAQQAKLQEALYLLRQVADQIDPPPPFAAALRLLTDLCNVSEAPVPGGRANVDAGRRSEAPVPGGRANVDAGRPAGGEPAPGTEPRRNGHGTV